MSKENQRWRHIQQKYKSQRNFQQFESYCKKLKKNEGKSVSKREINEVRTKLEKNSRNSHPGIKKIRIKEIKDKTVVMKELKMEGETVVTNMDKHVKQDNGVCKNAVNCTAPLIPFITNMLISIVLNITTKCFR